MQTETGLGECVRVPMRLFYEALGADSNPRRVVEEGLQGNFLADEALRLKSSGECAMCRGDPGRSGIRWYG